MSWKEREPPHNRVGELCPALDDAQDYPLSIAGGAKAPAGNHALGCIHGKHENFAAKHAVSRSI